MTDAHAQPPPHDVRVGPYIGVFAALMALTLITVAVSYLDLPEGPTVAVALAIAALKAGLVAIFFMHLKGERSTVQWTLALTVFLFVGLLLSLLWSEGDHLFGTRFMPACDQEVR